MDDLMKGLSRRGFLQGSAAVGLHAATSAWMPEALVRAAGAKKISLLEDGGFTGSAWGWQFTGGASVAKGAGRGGAGAVHVTSADGEYARFLVLGPVNGASYTLSGWVRTEGVVAGEEGAGAYVSASQFEFQGRPTEFTVDGKQATEIRWGNYTGSVGWTRFTQTVKCLPTTAWFEVVVGLYRASGAAWFSGLTFVEGAEGAAFEDTVTPREAARLAHRAGRMRPRAAILSEAGLPVKGAVTEPKRLAEMLKATHDVALISAAQMADPGALSRAHFEVLVLGYGEVFPLAAREAMLRFLADGGDLITVGGYAFQSPVVKDGGAWRLVSETLKAGGKNVLPGFASWKGSDAVACTVAGGVARVTLPKHVRMQGAEWHFDLPASGDGKQFWFSAKWRVQGVEAAPDGMASVGVEQLDKAGNPTYAARVTFGEALGTSDWKAVERLFYLVPECVTLRVKVALKNATGVAEMMDARLEERPAQVRINTAFGWPEDSLNVTKEQLGLFDADYRLKRVAGLRATDGAESKVAAEGYAASGVVGMNYARWTPLLEAVDASGRKRGAAGALMHHYHGPYTRSSWAFFGVENSDVFATKPGEAAFRSAAKTLARKCYLHSAETDYATYRDGETVRMRVLVSNYGLREAKLRVQVRVMDGEAEVHRVVKPVALRVGETVVVEEVWKATRFDAEQYEVRVSLLDGAAQLDEVETAFNVWKDSTLAKGMKFAFKDNYFQVEGRSVFLQGTDDYLHTFIDQDENPGTWLKDARGCRDSAIDVYENLMGLRGPQHRPTETWWRWVDAMLLNTQRVGGIFFPGMLVFSNTAVSDVDLADQKAYVKAFAKRYGGAAGIMYYLNGDLQLHDPNLPDLQRLYNDFLKTKYTDDAGLRAAWTVSPPKEALGKLTIVHGSGDWHDVRTLDDFQFRTFLVRRWLNAMHDAIREVDTVHPVTAEFYQSPVSGIDLLTALGKLELANFGYFADKDEDYYRFPQVCRFLDQSMRGKGINVGEFGVKTHPAWDDTGYYIEARTETYEQSYFLSLAHYGFALGASKIQNWCWKYPADLPFEWGINYPNDMVPRDVRAFYRNSGILFRWLRPKYEAPTVVMLLASDCRMGGQGHRIVEGQLNAVRLLMDENVRFGTLTDEFLDELPGGVKTIFYPLPYCPSDAIVARLETFVRDGGQLYVSGDLSFDPLRRRTRTERLKRLCGVEFVSERYAGIEYGKASVATVAKGAWPGYDAAPSIVMKAAGARVLLSGVDGHPMVVEHVVGKGSVVFSADPMELHGDARYQQYGHEFYKALISELKVDSLPMDGVHCLAVPQQDARVVEVLVNHGAGRKTVTRGGVRVALETHLPGVVVSKPGKGVVAVESSGDVVVHGAPLVTSDLHAMAIAFGGDELASASRVLVLPMGTGKMRLHRTKAFVKPVMLVGEIVDGRWKQYSARPFDGEIVVDAEIALSMVMVCEDADRTGTIAAMELWMDMPWKMGDAQ